MTDSDETEAGKLFRSSSIEPDRACESFFLRKEKVLVDEGVGGCVAVALTGERFGGLIIKLDSLDTGTWHQCNSAKIQRPAYDLCERRRTCERGNASGAPVFRRQVLGRI